MTTDLKQHIHEQVTSNRVALYMKGTPQFPSCGYSANAARILNALGVGDALYVNMIQQPELLEPLREYASWPTLPALFVKGEFIGGSDIMTEMYQSGELKQLLED
ncbi:MAG: monothiol glutaredoxin, Grx4 family [Gallionellales bacterium GWA2_60_18]|nr:MAG: monothiol glutaredoxin, Grx4 family [Gallionellales bacterium GWA2_60_18]